MSLDINALTSFEKMITLSLMKVVYFIGLALISLSSLVVGLAALSNRSAGFGLLVLASGALGVLVWRVLCETFVLAFSIYDRLSEIRDRLPATSAARAEQNEQMNATRGAIL